MRGVVQVDQVRKQLGDQTLFVVERMMDGRVDPNLVVYAAERRDNVLNGVQFKWRNADNLAQCEDVSAGARDMFYGIRMHKPENTAGLYRILVQCFKDRFIDLHLKKCKDPHAGPGKVVAKAIINGKRCTLDKVYTELTKFPPAINAMWICGTHNKEYVEEKLVIDPSILNRFDVTSFLPML